MRYAQSILFRKPLGAAYCSESLWGQHTVPKASGGSILFWKFLGAAYCSESLWGQHTVLKASGGSIMFWKFLRTVYLATQKVFLLAITEVRPACDYKYMFHFIWSYLITAVFKLTA